MELHISEHSVAGWRTFADAARFVPDPMILRVGEVFVNGAGSARTLRRPDLAVLAALRANIAGLVEFFDLVVAYDRVPLIAYHYSYDPASVPTAIGALLGPRALPVTIGYDAYEKIKAGAFASLAAIDLDRIARFGLELAELDALRDDWRPSFEDAPPTGWLTRAEQLEEPTRRAAQFLLGGLIFSGFAQASLTDHIIQPKRSRFFLALTAGPPIAPGVSRADEDAVFAAAETALRGTGARTRRLAALPPVLPYLLAKAPPDVTAGDLLKRALDFANTRDGENFRMAVALVSGDGVGASHTADLAKAAKTEALALLRPYSTLATSSGGLKVEASLGLEGPSVSVSRTLTPPAWLRLWWNEHAPFGGLRKTFRRMWLASASFEDLERRLIAAWART